MATSPRKLYLIVLRDRALPFHTNLNINNKKLRHLTYLPHTRLPLTEQITRTICQYPNVGTK